MNQKQNSNCTNHAYFLYFCPALFGILQIINVSLLSVERTQATQALLRWVGSGGWWGRGWARVLPCWQAGNPPVWAPQLGTGNERHRPDRWLHAEARVHYSVAVQRENWIGTEVCIKFYLNLNTINFCYWMTAAVKYKLLLSCLVFLQFI